MPSDRSDGLALASRAIKTRASRLADHFNRRLALGAGLIVFAIDIQLLDKIANLAAWLDMIAQRRAAGGNRLIKHLLDAVF
jgi:hypothetical protein